MTIERLAITSQEPYQPHEAAVHLNRYMACQNLCKDKTVLDMACGVGYGTNLMGNYWGAKQAVGIDISPEAIEIARQEFTSENTNFYCGAIEEAGQILQEKKFDLIVSLETFEHLEDPKVLLQAIQNLRTEQGKVVVSCPNDYWYYPKEDQKNPFHLRKYTYEDFFSLCESVFGPSSCRLVGVPVQGYANFLTESPLLTDHQAATAMFNYEIGGRHTSVPAGTLIDTRNSSYYIGIWDFSTESNVGALQREAASVTTFPLTTDINELDLLRKNDRAQHAYVNELLALQEQHTKQIQNLEEKINRLRQNWLSRRLLQWMGE